MSASTPTPTPTQATAPASTQAQASVPASANPTVVTRFAPSPTGSLHIGSVRTALFSWLYAAKCDGEFNWRLEDTDFDRSIAKYAEEIFAALNWLGIKNDGEIIFQSKRLDIYKEYIEILLNAGKAYKCYCSKDRLDDLRAQQLQSKLKPKYDGHCLNIDKNLIKNKDQYVVRFKNPTFGEVVVQDLVLGNVIFQNSELDDLIIAREDGTPTYNFAAAIDDYLMKITHVIRGNDHLNNTPKQINILNAIGAQIPKYAHIPMILNLKGEKLSKRDSETVYVMQYRDDGYLPSAILNYLARLGWAHGDKEIFTIDELKQLFDLKGLNKSSAKFDVKKLQWINQKHLQMISLDDIRPELVWHLNKLGIKFDQKDYLDRIISLQRNRVKNMKEMAEKSVFLFMRINDEIIKNYVLSSSRQLIELLLRKAKEVPNWNKAELEGLMHEISHDVSCKSALLSDMRIMLTGSSVSPPIVDTMEILGKNETICRIQEFLDNH